MSTTSIAVPAIRPGGAPASLAAAFPADLSRSPLLGILGVLLGAGIVTLTGPVSYTHLTLPTIYSV